MITYLYWAVVFALVFGVVYLFGSRLGNWKGALISAGVILLVG